MFDSAPIERLYTPIVAYWWLGMVTCLHIWAGMAGNVEPPRRHLRLVTDRGRLVENS